MNKYKYNIKKLYLEYNKSKYINTLKCFLFLKNISKIII